MEKIAVGPGYPSGVVDLDAPVGENVLALARAKDVQPAGITVLVCCAGCSSGARSLRPTR
jgi:fructose-1,6-bisphosphatase II / sedoheptulose-1,7-bisphosphatase